MKPIQKIALISPNPRFPDFVSMAVGSENTLPYFDYAVREEGEETIIELLEALNGKRDLHSVKGIPH